MVVGFLIFFFIGVGVAITAVAITLYCGDKRTPLVTLLFKNAKFKDKLFDNKSLTLLGAIVNAQIYFLFAIVAMSFIILGFYLCG